MKVDVFLDSGVAVEIPDGTDIYSDKGYWIVKDAARKKLIDLLQNGDFDLAIEPSYEEDD